MNRGSLTRRLLGGVAATVTTAVAGCSGGEGGDTTPVAVGPDEGGFDPDTLTVETVRFVWESSGHNLRVDGHPSESDWAGVAETQDGGHEHKHIFNIPGDYEYGCEIHAEAGTLSVEESAGGSDVGY